MSSAVPLRSRKNLPAISPSVSSSEPAPTSRSSVGPPSERTSVKRIGSNGLLAAGVIAIASDRLLQAECPSPPGAGHGRASPCLR